MFFYYLIVTKAKQIKTIFTGAKYIETKNNFNKKISEIHYICINMKTKIII